MKIETSTINLVEALDNGCTLQKGLKVILPVEGEASIYGFLATVDDVFNFATNNNVIDMPPLGGAKVVSNRAICSIDGNLHRFPIFNSITKPSEEKYSVYLLYVPRLLNLESKSLINSYVQTMKNERPHQWVYKVDGIRVEDNIAYYYPKKYEYLFESSSKLRGIGNDFAVIVRRISILNGDIKYEIFNPVDIMIEEQ